MKKIYLLAIVFIIGFAGTSLGQYTATNSGLWSNSITWAPGAPPSSVCTNCTITINTGVTVTLDAHVELSGSSILTLGSGGDGSAKILIQSSYPNATTIQTGYNIVLDYLPGASKIVLSTSNSTIDGTSAGTYDGIFNGPLPSSFYQKAVGNAPNLFLGNTIVSNGPAIFGQSLTGPNSLLADGALPILLTDFNVSLNDNISTITWTTALEVNFSHFIVQRSGDGSTWESIGTIPGKNTGGTTYSFNDPSPLHGNNYYRLQYVDLDGNSKFSYIKFVRGSLIHGLRFGPNPASDHVGITFGSDISSSVLVRLVNQYGAILQEKQISNAAGSTVLFKVNNYPAGIYTLQVKAAEGNQSAFRVLVSH